MYESPDATLIPVVGVAALASGLDVLVAILLISVVAAVVIVRRLRHNRRGRR